MRPRTWYPTFSGLSLKSRLEEAGVHFIQANVQKIQENNLYCIILEQKEKMNKKYQKSLEESNSNYVFFYQATQFSTYLKSLLNMRRSLSQATEISWYTRAILVQTIKGQL